MDCIKFQDSISDYLDSALDARMRTECAAHRLVCRECRELYNDVRATVHALNSVAHHAVVEPEGLEIRIIAATTAGEMLSCGDFDKLIERYFDGVILAPTFQTFQAHFEKCAKCRRLMAGIEETIEMCREIKETEVEVPDSLYDRIVAATVGAKEEASGNWFRRAKATLTVYLSSWARPLWSPQMAVAALIFAASSLIILSRFGSVRGMASHAGTQAEMLVNQGHRAINNTGAMARTGLQRVSYGVNTLLFDGRVEKPASIKTPPNQPQNRSGAQPALPQNPESQSGSPQRDKSEQAPVRDKNEEKTRHRNYKK